MESGPASFAADLRALRGHRSYQELAAACDRSVNGLVACLTGEELPPLRFVEAYVTACGADPGPWRARWLKLSGAPRPWWARRPRRRTALWSAAAAVAAALTATLIALPGARKHQAAAPLPAPSFSSSSAVALPAPASSSPAPSPSESPSASPSPVVRPSPPVIRHARPKPSPCLAAPSRATCDQTSAVAARCSGTPVPNGAATGTLHGVRCTVTLWWSSACRSYFATARPSASVYTAAWIEPDRHDATRFFGPWTTTSGLVRSPMAYGDDGPQAAKACVMVAGSAQPYWLCTDMLHPDGSGV